MKMNNNGLMSVDCIFDRLWLEWVNNGRKRRAVIKDQKFTRDKFDDQCV